MAWNLLKNYKIIKFELLPEKKTLNTIDLRFQDSLFKISFKNILIGLCYIYIINTNTVIRSQTDLGFHCFYLDITWEIHGISCHQRRGNPAIGIKSPGVAFPSAWFRGYSLLTKKYVSFSRKIDLMWAINDIGMWQGYWVSRNASRKTTKGKSCKIATVWQ